MIIDRSETPQELAFTLTLSAAKNGARKKPGFATFPIRRWNMRQIFCAKPMNCMRNRQTSMFPTVLR